MNGIGPVGASDSVAGNWASGWSSIDPRICEEGNGGLYRVCVRGIVCEYGGMMYRGNDPEEPPAISINRFAGSGKGMADLLNSPPDEYLTYSMCQTLRANWKTVEKRHTRTVGCFQDSYSSLASLPFGSSGYCRRSQGKNGASVESRGSPRSTPFASAGCYGTFRLMPLWSLFVQAVPLPQLSQQTPVLEPEGLMGPTHRHRDVIVHHQ